MPEGESTAPKRSASQRMSVGVVLERRDSSHPWQDHSWRVAGLLPGGGPGGGWRLLGTGPGWQQFYAGSLPLTLFAGETEGYGHNLMAEIPKVFVVLRSADAESRKQAVEHDQARDQEQAPEPFLVTACPFEAQDYLDSGEQPVEAVPMPEPVRAWVQSFVDRHHVAKPFHKRRKRSKAEDEEVEMFVRRPGGATDRVTRGR